MRDRLSRSLTSILAKAVFGLRAAMLERPATRAVLRRLGAPVIAVVHRRVGRTPPEVVAAPHREPVLRLRMAYAPPAPPPFRILVALNLADPAEVVEAQALVACLPQDNLTVRHAPPGHGFWLAGLAGELANCDLVLAADSLADLRRLLASADHAAGALEVFAREPAVGVLALRRTTAPEPPVFDEEAAARRAIAANLGFALYPDSPFTTPGGLTFWARPAALSPLLGLAARRDDRRLADFVFHACELAGLRWARVHDGDVVSAAEQLLVIGEPKALRDLTTRFGRSLLAPGRRPSGVSLSKDQRRALCRAELERFMAGTERLVLPTVETPRVSVLLVLYNQAELTLQCLKSLVFALGAPCEVIVVDNASGDETAALMARVDGVRYARNGENLHFLRAANQAAALAHGERLLFLNNDTRVDPGAISAALARLDAEDDLGAVGGRIDLADGALQEAGSIVYADGACAGYGRGADPWRGEYQFARDVDYVSGAFLMTPRGLFERLDGFDPAYAPAYYEETDYCMRLWEAGLRVAYEPRVRLEHFEFGSATASVQALALQETNRKTFARRHAATLAVQPQPRDGSLRARMRSSNLAGRVLVLDDRAPQPDHGAGAPRAIEILRGLHQGGWFVSHYPLLDSGCDYEAVYRHIPRDVEIVAERGVAGLEAFLRERAGYYDAVVVSRPHNMLTFRQAWAKAFPDADLSNVIYDAEAVFALRDPANTPQSQAVLDELELARGAAGVLVVGPGEAALYAAAGLGPVEIVGHAREPDPTPASFAARKGLLFVGALDQEGPNADSLTYFLNDVRPALDRLIGADWVLEVIGRTGAPSLAGLGRDPRVRLLGRVEDLVPHYDRARVFVAPTRFAAGIPMKVHEAAAHGLPAVITPLLAGQLGWSEAQAGIGDGPETFAAAVAALYTELARWDATRAAALVRLAADCDPRIFSARLDAAVRRAADFARIRG